MKHTLFALVLTAGLAGCSSSSSDGGTATAADPCVADCDRQVAAGCSKTPASYGDACKSFCTAGKKATKPECAAQFDAQYTCAKNKITYSCNDSGLLTITPSGACGAEAAACMSCNGGKLCSAITVGG